MSLTLLPAVDVRDGKAVRLRQGESGSETDYGSPLEAARTWVEAGAEWIHLVDLDAAFGTGNNRAQLREIVHELGDKVNIEMSGGVRDDDSLSAALEAGAARVNIGTAALENPEWTASVIKRYGDRVAIGLDVRGHTLAARGWVKEGGDLFETMKFLDSVGCSRYVVTDVARDGMMSGPNIDLLREARGTHRCQGHRFRWHQQAGRPARYQDPRRFRRGLGHPRQVAVRPRVHARRGARSRPLTDTAVDGAAPAARHRRLGGRRPLLTSSRRFSSSRGARPS